MKPGYSNWEPPPTPPPSKSADTPGISWKAVADFDVLRFALLEVEVFLPELSPALSVD